jgi:hypothetical protein
MLLRREPRNPSEPFLSFFEHKVSEEPHLGKLTPNAFGIRGKVQRMDDHVKIETDTLG